MTNYYKPPKAEDKDYRWCNLYMCFFDEEDLTEANFSCTVIPDVVFNDVNLSKAKFVNAKVENCVLERVDLSEADFTNANLEGSTFSAVKVERTIFTGADFSYVDLIDVDLRSANLSDIKADVFEILGKVTVEEAEDVLYALKDGRIDGISYSSECACLVGTIANIRGQDYTGLKEIYPDSNRPAERWFLAIRQGYTPENHQIASITAEWIEEFLSQQETTEQ